VVYGKVVGRKLLIFLMKAMLFFFLSLAFCYNKPVVK